MIVSCLYDTLLETPGWGLSAPQVGINEQIFVITIGKDRMAVVNPTIITKEGEEVKEEGCLSIPGIKVNVPRPEKIQVEFLDLQSETQVMLLSGVWARVFQHEYDHLQGKLILDYLKG
jgi:peptide deformylase